MVKKLNCIRWTGRPRHQPLFSATYLEIGHSVIAAQCYWNMGSSILQHIPQAVAKLIFLSCSNTCWCLLLFCEEKWSSSDYHRYVHLLLAGCNCYTKLHTCTKQISNKCIFQRKLKESLIKRCYYSVQEYID